MLDQNAGTVHNSGTITGAMVSATGTFNNLLGSTVADLEMLGGTVNNAGRITAMAYTAGNYNFSGTGSIGALTLAGDATGVAFGSVGNLAFASNGDGFLAITASTPTSFSNDVNARDSVNLANGNISLDLTALAGDHFGDAAFGGADDFAAWIGFGNSQSFSLSDMFGGAGVSNVEGLNTFDIVFGNDSFNIFNSERGWATHGLMSFSYADGIISTNVVPEPATLAIIGLGLVGLGYARSRQKRKTLAA